MLACWLKIFLVGIVGEQAARGSQHLVARPARTWSARVW